MAETRPPGFVIAISGTSGAGKTTLVQKVAERLGDAVALHFDDYYSVSKYPSDARLWVDAGADPDQWQTTQLADDLRRLRAGQTITLPKDRGTREPRSYIVLEEPFGRSRREMAANIDFVVYVDLPLEVALARKLIREYGWVAGAETIDNATDKLKGLLAFFQRYLESLRDLYLAANESARASSDLVLDGTKPPDELAEEIVRALRKQHGG